MAKLYTNIKKNSGIFIKKFLYNWNVLFVTDKKEKFVLSELKKKNIEAFLPLETVIKQWSDRKKKLKVPLFPSYVFVKSSEKEYFQILNIKGVYKFISFNNKLAIVPDVQIEALKELCKSENFRGIIKNTHKKGDKIRITNGPFHGLEGELINDVKNNSKIVMRIANIGYSLIIDSSLIEINKLN